MLFSPVMAWDEKSERRRGREGWWREGEGREEGEGEGREEGEGEEGLGGKEEREEDSGWREEERRSV